jgi:transposase InsO family protein
MNAAVDFARQTSDSITNPGPSRLRELLARGLRVGKERLRRLMQRHGIRAKGKRKFVEAADSAHRLPVAPDLVQRHFTPPAPSMV